jgi:antitoxin component YwqK of YwqJK toxin-antitoxin module
LVTTYREGKPHRSKLDRDGDKVAELTIEYQNGLKTVQREDRNSNQKFDLITYFDAKERPARIEEDTDSNGSLETITFYEAGKKVRAEKDRNGDRKPDQYIFFEGDQVVRQEEDNDYDGVVDVRSRAGDAGTRIQEADTNSDGKIDTWITSTTQGEVIKKETDQNADGKPDLIVFLKKDKVDRLEQDSDGGGCIDLKQWFDGAEKVRVEYRDNSGNCKIDVWSYFENGVLVRQGQDTQSLGYPETLTHFDSNGTPTIQEAVNGKNRSPDKKLFLNSKGEVTAQCVLDSEGKKLNTRMNVSNGVMIEMLTDTTGNGFADQREVYENGGVVRLDVDTNDDRMPDIAQSTGPDGVSRQDEDTDFDGVVDQRFDGDAAVEVPAGTQVAGAKLGKLDCGSFHSFWWKR